MKSSLLTAIFATAVLSGCMTTELSTAQRPYDPSQDARVHVYGQNGRPATLTVNINGRVEKITVGGSMGQAFGSMLGVKGNESIGMPATELSKNPSAHSKILSGIFFKEFIVPAGKPVTVKNSIASISNMNAAAYNANNTNSKIIALGNDGCSGQAVTFTPEAGKDYEVAPISTGRHCGVSVYEIN